MEKRRMGHRKRSFCIGLLIFSSLFLFFNGTGLQAEEENEQENQPELRIETSANNPTVDKPWSLFLLVNHPRQQEVSVDPPRFPPSLFLERVRTDTVLITEGEKWTRFEFRFTPNRTGAITLDPFTVKIQRRVLETEPLSYRVYGVSVRRYDPRLRWQSPAPAISMGEKGELFLELLNWDPLKKPPESFFQGKLPVNAIFYESPIRASEQDGYRYKISIIPLSQSDVILEPFSITHENYVLNIPGIKVQVLPALEKQNLPAGTGNVLNESSSEKTDEVNGIKSDIPFPEASEKIFFLVRGEYDQVYSKVKALWENNNWAEAIAEIRRNERDNIAGPLFVNLRREMETKLGLDYPENENWRPLRIPLFFYISLFIAVPLALAIVFVSRPKKWFRIKNFTFRIGNGLIFFIVLMAMIGLFFIFVEESLGNFPASRSLASRKTVILRETQSYRVPDFKGAVNDFFKEGQSVTIGDYREDWCFAETPDGRSGWVRHDSIIVY